MDRPRVVIAGTDHGVRPDDVAFAIPMGGDERTEVEQCTVAILALYNGVGTVTAADIKNATDDFADKTRERARRELTRANVLKHGYTGTPKEPGEVIYSVDRRALTVFAKKLGDRHTREWGTPQKTGDLRAQDQPPPDDDEPDPDDLFGYAAERIPSVAWADYHR
jgi:hypothetical protein